MSKKATTKKTVKRPKDVNAPKRPQSSYFLFMNERRPILKSEHNDKSMTDISKVISQEWKCLNESEKSKYVEKANELKKGYNIRLEEYKKTDNFKKYQNTLAKWKEEQKEARDAESDPEPTTAKRPQSSSASRSKSKAKAKNKKKESDSEDEDSDCDSDDSSSDGSDDTSSSSESESDSD
mmetsp:Transcript_11987/g.18090  ORF Transcript_11987/g.18090 Transcript_11987/m.18090 type:complete len:180 (+) Transcript_11987:156-695(+)